MKTPKPLSLALLLFGQLSVFSQVQWYQNQDGNNPAPYGTYASAIQVFNSNSFIACYQWQVNNDEYTWKISKTLFNGSEVREFLVTGIGASAEIRVRENNSVYVLKRSFPYGQPPEYTVFRLNGNFDIQAQRTFVFPGDYSIINLNAFEIDRNGNLYLAGDGQFPDGPGYTPASFIMKTNRDLSTKWLRMDTLQTSYTKLLVDDQEKVTVIEDFYTSYPNIKVNRINRLGNLTGSTTLVPDAARFSLNAMLDRNNQLLLFGGKMVNDTTQAAFICRVSATSGQVLYRKTHFAAPASQLNDIKIDNQGKMYSLATLYFPDQIQTRISRINPGNGALLWNKIIPFSADSCQFTRLVMNNSERFYAVGEKKSGTYFAKAFALRMHKNGQIDERLPAPDSVAWQRYHTLVDGIIDRDQELIAIGNTNDLDTMTYSSTYYRAFAARYHEHHGCHSQTAKEEAVAETEGNNIRSREPGPELQLFPNPVTDQLNISGLDPALFDQLFIYDMQGNMIHKTKITNGYIKLDLGHVAGGVYLLVLRSSTQLKEKTIKFVISK